MKMDLIVHTATEAGFKTGGVGATLYGLLSVPRYHEDVARTVFLGPFFRQRRAEFERVRANVRVKYLDADGIHDVTDDLREKFRAIEARHRVEILYGTRTVRDRTVDVILVDGASADAGHLNYFKHQAYEIAGLSSYRYESIEGFDECMAIAVPGLRAVYTLTDLKELGRKSLVVHDIASMPFLYASLAMNLGLRNLFALHEVSCARHFVEWHEGGDLAFYNLMARHLADRRAVRPPDFNECRPCHKGAMFGTLSRADRILSIGDSLEDELAFVVRGKPGPAIRKVYRGVPCYDYPFERKAEARKNLLWYASSILGFLPDFVFTHVSRMIPSKAQARDLEVLARLDPLLAAEGKRAILVVLSSAVPEGRLAEDVAGMEKTYGWPVHHRRGYPDLIGAEVDFNARIAEFNAGAKAIRAILVNQFGWSREKCGQAIPAGMEFEDLRLGTDAEFGLSDYEPFGVSPLEPLTVGAIPVLSTTSGAVGLLRERLGAELDAAIVFADYKAAAAGIPSAELLEMTVERRRELEAPVAEAAARRLHELLPRDEAALRGRMLRGRELAGRLSWNVVYDEYWRAALLE